MALVHFEGFDAFTAGGGIVADLANSGQYFGWTSNGGTTSTGLLGGKQWESGGGGNNELFFTSPTPIVTSIIGMRIRIPVVTATNSVLLLYDSTGATQIGICITGSATLAVYRNSTATILATGTTTIVAGAYYYLEMQSTINSSTGSVQVNLNGNSEISASGLNTQNSANTNVQGIQWRWFSATTMGIDDFYWSDTTGSAPYNTFLYNATYGLRVETLFPTANNSVGFTPAASTNVSQIQETSSDNDTTYNLTQVPAIDTFTHGGLSSNPQTIFAVNVTGKLRSDDVSNMTVRNKLISGGTTTNGVTTLAPTVYQYIKDQYINDPNTSNPWTGSAVNNSIIGYERIT